MDYSKLLKIAESKRLEADYKKNNLRINCDTSLPPPKKLPKSNVQSDAIKSFLARKKAEEIQKEKEAQRKKNELLALRETSKSKTKAHIMASRTKDNDFSRIKLTDDEVEAKKRRENELVKLSLKDKVSRMKARIELEEKEKLIPKKRKRKLKNQDDYESQENEEYRHFSVSHSLNRASEHLSKNNEKGSLSKRPKLPPPSFRELLELAEKKQYEPVKDIPVFGTEVDARPLTKKARRLLQEEENSIRRKLAAEAAEKKGNRLIDIIPNAEFIKQLPKIALKKRPDSEKNSSIDSSKEIRNGNTNGNFASTKKPLVSPVQKHSNDMNRSKSLPIPKKLDRILPKKKPEPDRICTGNNSQVKSGIPVGNTKVRVAHQSSEKFKERAMQIKNAKISENSLKNKECLSGTTKMRTANVSKEKVVKTKTQDPTPAPSQNNGQIIINEDIMAEIERRVRSKVQKELEEKFMQQKILSNSEPPKLQVSQSKSSVSDKSESRLNVQARTKKIDCTDKQVKAHGSQLGEKKVLSAKGSVQKFSPKPERINKDLSKAKLPPKHSLREEKPRKPAFHPNPYLEPPRRLLESQRPQKPIRRLESDDDDEEDDDDEMNDFIDDGCGDNDEDYSKYIKEIFGYDKSRYIDDDDDDVIESSFAEQMKEEVRSANIGLREDLEDIMKEKEELNRKKKKKKLKK